MIIYTSKNAIHQQTYGDNQFRINHLLADDYITQYINNSDNKGAVRKDQYPKFWGTRDNTIDTNFKILFSDDKFTRQDFEGVLYANGIEGIYAEDISQVHDSIKSWYAWDDIKHGVKDGAIITVDTETYGDILDSGNKSNQVFGISEIGITRTTYKDGHIYLGEAAGIAEKISGTSLGTGSIVDMGVLDKGYSETIVLPGFGKKEMEYANSIIRKWEEKGLAGLTKDEELFMRRMSVYSKAEIGESKVFQGLISAKGMSEQITDIQAAKLGIRRMTDISEAYAKSGTSQADAIFRVLHEGGVINGRGTLAKNIKTRDNVLNFANSKFDINAFANVLEASGQSKYIKVAETLRNSRSYITDTTYFIRALAAKNHMSVNELLRSKGFKGGGAGMESLLDSLYYTMEQMHTGGSDSSNQRFVTNTLLDKVSKNELATLALDENGVPSGLKRANADAIYFMKNGAINKSEGLEFASVNGKVTQNYSFRGQFWTIDKEHTGWADMQVPTDIDGKTTTARKFVVTFKDQADIINGIENPTTVTLSANTPEELGATLGKNAIAYSKDELSDSLILSQKIEAQDSLGQRAWDRFLNTADTAYEYSGGQIKAINGFQGLKDTMSLIDQLGINEGDYNTTTGVADILRLAEEKKIKLNPYEAQELAALTGKINNERPMLDRVIKSIEDNIPIEGENIAVGNFTRTHVLSNALNEIYEAAGVQDVQVLKNVYDKFGIDIRVGEDLIARIDAQTTSTAARDINRMVNKHMMSGQYLDKHKLGSAIGDLVQRGVIPKTVAHDLDIARLDTSNVYHAFTMPLAEALHENNLKQGGIIRPIGGKLESSRIRMYDDVPLYQRFKDTYSHIIAPDGTELQYPSYVDKSLIGKVDQIVAKNIATAPKIAPLASSPRADKHERFDSLIKQISEALGIHDPKDQNVVYGMFFSSNDVTKEMNDYAIGKYLNEDVAFSIITNDSGNRAYVAVSKGNDMQKFIQQLSTGDYDLSSYNRFTANKDIFKHAAIFEIPHINEYKVRDVKGENPLGMGTLRTATLGDTHEIMLVPQMRTTVKSTDTGERVSVYLNSGSYDMLASYRIVGNGFMNNVKEGNYERASKLINNERLSKLMDLPSSASAASMFDPSTGKIVRQIGLTPTDIMYADAVKIGSALYNNKELEEDALDLLFEKSIKTENPDLMKVINEYIQNRGVGDVVYRKKINGVYQSDADYFIDVFKNSRTGFQEYFAKHKFQSFGSDNVISTIDNKELLGKNFFDLIEESIDKNNPKVSKITFDKQVSKSLKTFRKLFPNGDLSKADLLRSVGFYQAHMIGTNGVTSAFYNLGASSSNIIRPTYGQMNNPVRFNVQNAIDDFAPLNDGKYSFYRASAGNLMYNANLEEAYNVLTSTSKKANAIISGTETDFLTVLQNTNDVNVAQKISAMKKFTKAERYEMFKDIIGNRSMLEDDKKWEKGLDYFASQLSSFEEGSAVIHPYLMASRAMTMTEGSNLEMPIEKMDIARTRRTLSDIVEKGGEKGYGSIKKGDILGFMKNGSPWYYTGNEAYIDEININDLIPEGVYDADELVGRYNYGKTKIAEAGAGDFYVRKVLIGGNEKTIVRSVSGKGWARAAGYSQRDSDLKVANRIVARMFDYVSDGATIIANLNIEKHGANFFMQNKWNMMTSTLEKTGELNKLYNLIRDSFSGVTAYEGNAGITVKGIRIMDPSLNSGRWLMDDSNAQNAAEFTDRVFDLAMSSKNAIQGLSSEAIDTIASMNKYFTEHNMVMIRTQRQHINPFMGDFMRINSRIEQTMYLLGQGGFNANDTQKILEQNHEYMNMLRKYSTTYNARSENPKGIFNSILDTVSEGMNRDRVAATSDLIDKRATRSIGGMITALQDATENEIKDDLRYATISLDDIVHNEHMIATAMSSEDALQNAPVLVDGKRTKFLSSILGNNSDQMVRVDLNTNISYTIDGTKYTKNSVLIPVHDITTRMSTDKYTMALDQKATSKFLSTVRNIKMNPNDKDTSERIANAYMTYITELRQQLTRDDKNSTLFKYANSYIMPTSIQVMAESEASALTTGLANNKAFVNAVNEEQTIAKQIAESGISKNADIDEMTSMAKDYARVISTKTNLMGEAATRIENGVFDELAVPTNKFIKDAMVRIDENGVKHYGMVAAMSQSAFEDIGLNMNAISYDIIRDYEAERFGNIAKARVPEVATMFGASPSGKLDAHQYTKFMIGKERTKIIERMNEALSQTNYKYTIDPDKSLIEQMDEIAAKILNTSQYSADKEIMRSLNEHTAKTGHRNAIFGLINAFTDASGNSLGSEYLQRVGIYAQLIRQPVFSSQPLSRIFLDKSMDGMGRTIRLFNPLYTSKMHVDFDGDTMFISAMLDGSSVLKSNTKKYETLVKLYNTYVDKFSNAGVAEHVREGAYAKTNLLYSEKAQRASLLQLINEESYDNAVKEFQDSDIYKNIQKSLQAEVASNNITQDSMDTVLKAFTAHSDEVTKAFDNAAVNFANDPRMIIASIAAKERNLYIGQASTPNFKLRDTLIAVFNTAQDDGMKERVAELLNDFTDTGSTSGGLLTILEQKMIDTKKAIDALNISEIGLYTLGIEQIKRAGTAKQGPAKAFKRAITNVIRGSGPNVYSFLRDSDAEEQIERYVRFAFDENTGNLRSYAQLKSIIQDIKDNTTITDIKQRKVIPGSFTEKDLDILNHIKAYRNMLDIYADKQNAATIAYFDMYSKSGSQFADSIASTIRMYEEFAEKAGIEAGFIGTSLETPMYETRQILLNRQRELERISKFKPEDILENRLYFVPNIEDSGIVFRGNGETWEPLGAGFIARNENGKLVGVSLGLNDESAYLSELRINEKSLTREQLNLIAQLEPSDLGAFLSNDNGEIARQYDRLVNKEISNVLDDFTQRVVDGSSVDLEKIYTNDRVTNAIKVLQNTSAYDMKNLMDAYDSIIADNPASKAVLKHGTSAMDLMRHMNSEIASTIRNISDPGADPNYLLGEVRKRMVKSLGTFINNPEQLLSETQAKSATFGGSMKEISEAIEYLRRNVYNVESEEAQLNTKYLELETLLEGLNKSPKVKQEAIKNLQDVYEAQADTVAEALTKIKTGNENVIKDTQNLVYKLIKDKGSGNFTEDLSALFEFTNPNMNSRVAFGELMGLRFRNLGTDDVKAILSASTEGLNEYETQAVNATKKALEAYKKLNPVIKNGTGFLSNTGNSEVTNSIINSVDEAIKTSQNMSGLSNEDLLDAYGLVNAERRDAARQAAKMNKKTIAGKILNKKTVAGVVGALAAIGIVNKIVHGKENDSPLVPSKSNDSQQGDEPSYDAPGTPKGLRNDKNIYVDEKRGISFKISAKTKNKMLAMNAASATNNYGQGRGSLRIHADNSKINSNWLQNRFAELSE